MKLFKKNSPFLQLLLLFIVINAVLRTVLLFHPITQSEFNIAEIIKMYALGGLSDTMIYVVGSAFLWLYLLFLSDKKYQTPNGYIVFAVLVLLLIYVSFFNTILDEYGGSLPEIGIAL